MCGISGIYAFNEIGRFSMINLSAANEALQHRGMDAAGLFDYEKVGLGHRRLSIIDLSSDGNQPMTDVSGRYTIVFNGEIYNFRALRNELAAQGVVFESQSDTEVLLYAFIHYGEKCLEKLHGFFAFAVFDQDDNSLFIARDRLGIKPLVYYLDEDKFLFSSEINSLIAFNIPLSIDVASVFQYFQLHYVAAPYSMLENVFKLPQGHFLKIKGRQIDIQPFYTVPKTYATAPLKDYESAKTQLVSLLEQSVQERLIADVPLGAFLSGGIDSSAVVAMASRHKPDLLTFSVGYEDEPFFDETNYANLVAKKFNTNHTVFKLSNDDLFEAIFEMLPFLGEPFADSSCIPFYILSQKTRQQVTVALSGDGADELFAGYNKYKGEFLARQGGFLPTILKNALPLLEMLPRSRNSPLANKIRQAHRLAESMHKTPKERYWYLTSFLEENKTRNIFSQKWQTAFQNVDDEYVKRKNNILQDINNQDFNEVLYSDVQTVLTNDMLHKVDLMSMAHALEVRVPFLDHRLVNFAFSLPTAFKINADMKKRIVQDAFREILPAELYRRPKHGFDVPLAKGFQTSLRRWLEKEVFDRNFIEAQGIFNPDYITKLKESVFKGGAYDQNHVWAIAVFQNWWKRIGFKNNA